ncbi:MAG: biotin transporter BioY [Candidatus Humimicrobiaceae bacterium]
MGFSLTNKKEISTKLLLSFTFVGLMVLSANTFFYLPFSPVPVTFQVLTVLLSSIVMGAKWAAFTQASYLFLGLMGLPVFSGFKNGIIALASPTGGYIIGFLVAAYATGAIYHSYKQKDRLAIFTSCFCGLLFIYFFGYMHLAFYFISNLGFSIGIFLKSLKLGVLPFIAFDLIKILLIANIIGNLKSRDKI